MRYCALTSGASTSGSFPKLTPLTIRKRQAEGIAAAKAKGKRFGRPRIAVPENWDEAYSAWKGGEITAKTAMEQTGLKRTSFYKIVNRL